MCKFPARINCAVSGVPRWDLNPVCESSVLHTRPPSHISYFRYCTRFPSIQKAAENKPWLIYEAEELCQLLIEGFVDHLLSWSALVPLSRLSYVAYLIHPMIISWCYYNQQTPLYVDTINMVIFLLSFLLFHFYAATSLTSLRDADEIA